MRQQEREAEMEDEIEGAHRRAQEGGCNSADESPSPTLTSPSIGGEISPQQLYIPLLEVRRQGLWPHGRKALDLYTSS